MGFKQDVEFSLIHKYIWTHSISQIIWIGIKILIIRGMLLLVFLGILFGLVNLGDISRHQNQINQEKFNKCILENPSNTKICY